MKLNFNFKIKDLSGKEIDNAYANKLLADMLSGLNSGNSAKLYDWALRAYRGEALEIDDTDGMVLKELVEKSALVVLVKKPLLDVIEKGLKPKEK
jgi:hypothetical protein